MKAPFAWDYNSDQPYQLKDKIFKKIMRKKEQNSLIKTGLYSLLVLPLSFMLIPFVPKRKIDTSKFFAMSVSLGHDATYQVRLIKELGVKNLLIRIPLADSTYMQSYIDFIDKFVGCSITINIMQDREHIENKSLLARKLHTIFNALSSRVDYFQVGTTINRAKWGFFSVDEYLDFYMVAQEIAYHTHNIKLLGPSVIDFEYHYNAHALFSQKKFHFDGISSLLYVDRRGAPEFRQMGFNLFSKIRLLASMMNLSSKSAQKLFITETNWPLSNTAPYAPTSEKECVSEEAYANFMIRYYLIALGTKQVDAIFWHQLIANGYGLIDVREKPRKRLAFTYLKVLVKFFSDLNVINLKKHPYYTLTCRNKHRSIQALWSAKGIHDISKDSTCKYYTSCGEEITARYIRVCDKVVYKVKKL